MKTPNVFRFLKSMLRSAIGRMAGIPVTVPRSVQDTRAMMCRYCPHQRDGQCLKCTCFILPKTWLSAESCPLKYWGQHLTPSNPASLFRLTWLLQKLAIRMFRALD